MFEFFRKLFDTDGFPARWYCGMWSEGHGWLHVLSDTAIFAAYMAIPVVLVYLMRKRGDIPFPKVMLLFTAFIALCGTGHLLEALIFWQPVYRFAGLMKFFTAVVSWATVIALVPTVREALKFRSPAQLEVEVAERTRELAREKAKLEAIVAAVGSGVTVLDEKGQPLLTNPTVEKTLGFQLRHSDTNPFSAVLDWPEGCGLFRLDSRRYPIDELPALRELRGVRAEDDYVVLRAPHRRVESVLFMSARPVEAQGFRGVVASFTDVTTQFDAERERERTAELEQFAYIASHDLKEPLRQISTFSSLLSEDLDEQLDDGQRNQLRIVSQSAARMQELIDGLLRYARVGGAEPDQEQVDVESVVQGTLADLASVIEEVGAEVLVGPLPSVLGDDAQLRLVFQNLIANAVKFKGDAPPRVHVSAQDELHRVRFSVKDNGKGIDPRHQERVFKIFARVDHGIDGTGVGLAMCKRIVERLGGRIWVESKLGMGTTFHFTIPRRRGDELKATS